MSVPHDASVNHLREMILGRSGPYADPRDAIDSLDNIQFWLSQSDVATQETALHSLLQLAYDDNIQVATGAVLALDFIRPKSDQANVLNRIVLKAENLARTPHGFRRDALSSLGSQIARFVARTSTVVSPPLWIQCLELPFIKPDVPALLALIAGHQPNFVLHVARRYLTPEHTSVLIQLPKHWMRIALATQFAPWPQSSLKVMAKAARWLKWDINDWSALEKVMRDQYPILTHPPGLPRDKRWWMIDGDGAEWTVWESVDGEYCIEVLQPGYAYNFKSFPISPQLVDVLKLEGHAAIAEQLKLWKRGKF